MQKQLTTEVGLGISHYNKIENGQPEDSVEMPNKLANFYGFLLTKLQILTMKFLQRFLVEDKTLTEWVKLINNLEQKDKNVIFFMLETMLTKKKFKNFFNKNVVAL